MTEGKIDEKKDDPGAQKGDKGHDQNEQEERREDHTPGQKTDSGRGGHRKRKGGNPDGSN